MKRILIAIIVCLLVALSACAPQIQCREPNKVVGRECCLDENDNGMCDSDEEEPEPMPEPKTIPKTVKAAEPEPEPEPQIDDSYNTRSTTASEPEEPEDEPVYATNKLEPGVYDISPGETKDWITVNQVSTYRSSRDKAYVDYMIYTVRNHGTKEMKLNVDMLFKWGVTSTGSDARVGKEYTLDKLKPGQKVITRQSLGITTKGIEETKEMELCVYDPFNVPRDDFDCVKKTFKPIDFFEDMEIYYYGKED